MAMVEFYLLLFLLPLLGLTVAGQEDGKFLHLQEPTAHSTFHPFSHANSPFPVAVSVSERDLVKVSSSVVLAERWLRSHVLAYFPSTNISTIVVGRGVLCNPNREAQWDLVLPSVKNVYYSLVRWGLGREIKVSVSFSSDCLDHHSSSSSSFRGDLVEKVLKPLLGFLQDSGSTYSINPPLNPSHSSEITDLVVSAHKNALQKLDFSHIRDIKMLTEGKPISRRLSSLTSTPYPPLSYPIPSNMPRSSGFPPSPRFASGPDGSLSFVPEASPPEVPTNPPETSAVPAPPCQAVPAVVPAPHTGEDEKGGLWCVAKPSVPAETLQEAMDYACGEGGADCEEIMPHGSCYYPDTVVSHASFAFNSYWQKTKRSGGSCNFGGTSILINSNPSFLHCRFPLT